MNREYKSEDCCINKSLIKERFQNSFETYNYEAYAQKEINKILIDMASGNCISPEAIFEIGCGTGILTDLICNTYNPDKLYINDLVDDAEIYLNKVIDNRCSFDFIPGDIEHVQFPSETDLIMSGSALQWVTDFDSFINKASDSLNRNGYLIFNTFDSGNFKEIKHITKSGINYLPVDDLKISLAKEFDILSVKSEEIKLYFNSPRDVLRHIKRTGTNAISRKRWTPADFNHFEHEYRRLFYSEKGFVLTYNPLYVVAKKR
jgi:malonyl-CoA O-methyltransferase